MAAPSPARSSSDPEHQRAGPLLELIRYALPTVVVIGGLVVMAYGDENHLEGGAGIVSAGLAIFFVNWLFRTGIEGDREREAEEAARDYYERNGRWPD